MSITLTTWSLEQTSPSDLRPATPPEGDDVVVRRAEVPSAEFSRFLYTAVGGDIRWSDRLSLTYKQWQEIVEKPGAEIDLRRWAEQAAEAGCGSVLLLPPNAYRADEPSVLAHYADVARVGIPVVAYNNPIDTKVDLVPDLLAKLHTAGSIVAVKEFSGDVRRAYEIAELAPNLDLLIGADDVLLELALAGAVGWIAGYPNALPASCAELYRAAVAGDLATARPLYSSLHSLLRWDSKIEFVQCIKLSMDIAGRRGGPTRPPRLPLTGATEAAVRTATEKAVADGHR